MKRLQTKSVGTAFYLLAAALVCFAPFLLLTTLELWPPVAMVQETFTTNFMWLKLMTDRTGSPISLPVGHAQILLFSYPVSLLMSAIFSSRSIFDQFQIFGQAWQLWAGIILMSAIVISLKVPLRPAERWLLLLAPLCVPLLIRSSNLGIVISYDRAEALIVIAMAIPLILWLCHDRIPRIGDAIFCGGVVAFAAATKLTFGIALVLFLVVMLAASPWRKWPLLILATAVGFCATLALLGVGFSAWNRDAMKFVVDQYIQFFKSPAVIQWDGSIELAFRAFLSPTSWYFSLQVAILATVVAMAGVAVARSNRRVLAFVGAASVLAVLEGFLLSQRLSLSAMFDVASFICLLCIVSISILLNRAQWWLGASVAAMVAFAFVSAPFFYDFSRGFATMQENTRVGKELQQFVTKPNLPMIYYHDGWMQPLIFPDPGIMLSTLLPEPGDAKRPLMTAILPGRRFDRHPDKGLLPGPQVAIVPEFLPSTPHYSPPLEVFGKYADFDNLRQAAKCREFQFTEPQPMNSGHYYYYSTRVTACIVE